MKWFIKNWGYKWYIQFIEPTRKNLVGYVSRILALIGSYYSFCEIETALFESNNLLTFFRSRIVLFVFITGIVSLLLHHRKMEHSAYLGSKDISITLKIADILKIQNTAIVIPTNTTFDTTMDESFIHEMSIQGQFQRKNYDVDFSELNIAIEHSLNDCFPNQYKILEDRIKTNTERYNIGTVAKVTHNTRHYYFLAIADVNKKGKPENVTMNNMTTALVGLWDYLTKEGRNEPITIPVIGTGRGGLADGTYEDVIHESIFSFISKSQDEFVAKKMTISIYPLALAEANVTWERLCNYLDLQCCYFTENSERVNSLHPVGKAIE